MHATLCYAIATVYEWSKCSGMLQHIQIKPTVDSLQSHFILTMSHWSSGLPVCFLSQGTWIQIPWGVLMWNRDSSVSFVSLHWWPRCDWSLWPQPELSLGPCNDNVIIPLILTQLSCPGFTLAAGLPSGFTADGVGCWGGGPCGESAISFHSHHVSLVQWITCLLMVTRNLGSNPLGGTYVNPRFSC